jgi:hypothetical protein
MHAVDACLPNYKIIHVHCVVYQKQTYQVYTVQMYCTVVLLLPSASVATRALTVHSNYNN